MKSTVLFGPLFPTTIKGAGLGLEVLLSVDFLDALVVLNFARGENGAGRTEIPVGLACLF